MDVQDAILIGQAVASPGGWRRFRRRVCKLLRAGQGLVYARFLSGIAPVVATLMSTRPRRKRDPLEQGLVDLRPRDWRDWIRVGQTVPTYMPEARIPARVDARACLKARLEGEASGQTSRRLSKLKVGRLSDAQVVQVRALAEVNLKREGVQPDGTREGGDFDYRQEAGRYWMGRGLLFSSGLMAVVFAVWSCHMAIEMLLDPSKSTALWPFPVLYWVLAGSLWVVCYAGRGVKVFFRDQELGIRNLGVLGAVRYPIMFLIPFVAVGLVGTNAWGWRVVSPAASVLICFAPAALAGLLHFRHLRRQKFRDLPPWAEEIREHAREVHAANVKTERAADQALRNAVAVLGIPTLPEPLRYQLNQDDPYEIRSQNLELVDHLLSRDPNAAIAVLGAKGAGKTTLLGQVQSHLEDSGRLVVNVDVSSVHEPEAVLGDVAMQVCGELAGVDVRPPRLRGRPASGRRLAVGLMATAFISLGVFGLSLLRDEINRDAAPVIASIGFLGGALLLLVGLFGAGQRSARPTRLDEQLWRALQARPQEDSQRGSLKTYVAEAAVELLHSIYQSKEFGDSGSYGLTLGAFGTVSGSTSARISSQPLGPVELMRRLHVVVTAFGRCQDDCSAAAVTVMIDDSDFLPAETQSAVLTALRGLCRPEGIALTIALRAHDSGVGGRSLTLLNAVDQVIDLRAMSEAEGEAMIRRREPVFSNELARACTRFAGGNPGRTIELANRCIRSRLMTPDQLMASLKKMPPTKV